MIGAAAGGASVEPEVEVLVGVLVLAGAAEVSWSAGDILELEDLEGVLEIEFD